MKNVGTRSAKRCCRHEANEVDSRDVLLEFKQKACLEHFINDRFVMA